MTAQPHPDGRGSAVLVLLVLLQVWLVVAAAQQHNEIPGEPTVGAADHDRLLYLERIPTVLTAVLLCALIAVFCWRRFGGLAAVTATAATAFTPLMLARAQWATLDVAAATALLGTTLALLRACRNASLGADVVVGAALGLALATGPIGLVALAAVLGVHAVLAAAQPRRLLRRGSIVLGTGWVVLSALHLPALELGWPPLPTAWLETTRQIFAPIEPGPAVYFRGELWPEAPAGYVPALLLTSFPPAWLLLLVAGAIAVVRTRTLNTAEKVALLVPGAVLIAGATQLRGAALEHLLPLVPLVGLGTAVLVDGTRPLIRLAALLAAGLTAVAGAACYPDFSTYRSPLAPATAGTWLATTDHGQALPALARELRERGIESIALAYSGAGEPAHHGIRSRPVTGAAPGWYAVSLSLLDGREVSTQGDVAWLRTLEPRTVIACCTALFEVSAEQAHTARAWQEENAALVELGMELLREQQRPRSALAQFDAVLASSPRHYGALYQRAVCLDALQQPAPAQRAWRLFLLGADALGDVTNAARARERLAALAEH